MYTPESLSALRASAGFDRIEVVTERWQNGLSPEFGIVAQAARDRVRDAAGRT
ncbi:hypothetical protein [Candidatus Solirubrobacter pratensis]|uniref:hypothetical protein n=1 Tax=Candidatus Solirubrobacter pratensis TaxID=1298857 RepID=UPI00041727C3|nr:hypothetical protein [Candidatus Solirubrobacter pratensis]